MVDVELSANVKKVVSLSPPPPPPPPKSFHWKMKGSIEKRERETDRGVPGREETGGGGGGGRPGGGRERDPGRERGGGGTRFASEMHDGELSVKVERLYRK